MVYAFFRHGCMHNAFVLIDRAYDLFFQTGRMRYATMCYMEPVRTNVPFVTESRLRPLAFINSFFTFLHLNYSLMSATCSEPVELEAVIPFG